MSATVPEMWNKNRLIIKLDIEIVVEITIV
jgi:hypothetical protein